MAEEYLSIRIKDALLNIRDLIPAKLHETIKRAEDNISVSQDALNVLSVKYNDIIATKLRKMELIAMIHYNKNLIDTPEFRGVLIEFLKEETAWNILNKGRHFKYDYSEDLVPQLLKYIDHDHVAKLSLILQRGTSWSSWSPAPPG
jgi:hypothetical protein